ncbi:hypothetical protein TH53_04405 [Pedobacter lusitanus]|uniref:Uncharacterized protein n=1 Tax=Pedobacter lusitanus TaxID=1503925 RepID=A0A0D0G0F1_9SPHI|nr:lantibiotic dehydratase [Pedobacter lusitanus]KIO78264.1 hypothetical protein TH53_04405 [Pedobacter lusitanus]
MLKKRTAKAYINELIDNQLLVSELEPMITGKEYVYQVIDVFSRIVNEKRSPILKSVLTKLIDINLVLKEIDLRVDNSVEVYHQLIELIRTMEIEFDENKLFQTDLTKEIIKGGLDSTIQNQLLEAVEVLSKICNPSKRTKMTTFARSFAERYDTQEIPLFNVLDPEIGIGYGVISNQHISPLTDHVKLNHTSVSEQVNQIVWDPLQRWIFSRLMDANKAGLYEISIKTEEISTFKSYLSEFPSSTSVVFRQIQHENLDISIEGVGGPSAGNFFGRFGHGSAAMNQTIESIIEHETNANPDVIFCEVVHLPENRVGNILLRPSYHEYEIPYLAQSSKSEEYTILLDDILVSVTDGIVYLRSKRLNKRIIPRLTSAHNSSFRTLPIYEFLCDIQTQQQCVGTYFNWGNLSIEFAFLPRLTFKNTVLFAATWGLSRTDLDNLYNQDDHLLPAAVSDFRKKWNLPALIILVDGDNELLVDLENILSVKTLLNTAGKKEKIVLREYLLPVSPDFLKDEQGELYANQYVASLLHHQETYKAIKTQRFVIEPDNESVQPRSYAFGSEWLYYKVYCGLNTSDKILKEVLYPLCNQLQNQGLIDEYFFMRYEDPKTHLRIRFHLTNGANDIALVSQLVNTYLDNALLNGHIWRVQIDPYVRELERYGSANISQIESIFYLDSKAYLRFLDQAFDYDLSTLRWMFVVKSIDAVISDFGFDLTERISLFKGLTNALSSEFGVDKLGKISIDKSYRDLRGQIEDALNATGIIDQYHISTFNTILSRRSKLIAPFVTHLKAVNTREQIDNIVVSIIHMIVNRGINANTRKNEVVIYNHLLKAYITRNAIDKKVSQV